MDMGRALLYGYGTRLSSVVKFPTWQLPEVGFSTRTQLYI